MYHLHITFLLSLCIHAHPGAHKENHLKVTAFQQKAIKQTITAAADDLQHVTEFLVAELHSAAVAESIIGQAVRSAAQRAFWLAVSDKAFADFGLDLPEYAKAGGTKVRLLVDREAVRFTQRLAKGA